MRKLILATLVCISFFSKISAQCPVAGFTMPDSICGGSSFQITNTSAPGLNYNWDLCPGDIRNTPTGVNYGADPNLAYAQQSKLIKDNNNYYLFIANLLGNNILRYDFGSSMDNIPTVYIYPGLTTLNQPNGLDIIKENGVWYALVANNANLTLVRIDLGSVISNNVATSVDLGQFGFNGPRGVKIAYDGTNYYTFVTNAGGSDIIKIEFGNSILNAPITSSPITNAALFNFTWGIDIKYDCTLSKWIGFVASFNLSQVHVLDFGTSLTNAPVIVSSFNTLANPSGIELVRDGNNWYALVVSYNFLKLQNFELQGNLLAAPVDISQDAVGNMNIPSSITTLKDSSRLDGFITNAAGSISHINWPSICNAAPSFSEDPTGVNAVINGSGYSQVSLEVTDNNGFVSYFNDSIYLNVSPATAFNFSSGCEGLPVNFTDSSTILSGNINSWQWNFGDLSPIDNNQNPTHTFSGTGNFNVVLTATSSSGCSTSDSAIVSISPLPIADFSFTNNQCSDLPVAFSDLSQALGGNTIISWTWDFGDSTIVSNDQSPVHIFNATGTFTVQLIIQTDAGCTDSISNTITIIPRPAANFTVAETCVGEIASFTNGTTISGGGAISYAWDFGDTFTSIVTNPLHTYTNSPANYFVQLIATAFNGCIDTALINIRIADKPVAAFSFSPTIICQGNAVNFTSLATGTGTDTISSYVWDFGDLSGSLLEDPFHAYADTGYYNVTLTVISPTNCDSSITQQLYIIPGPSASFSAAPVCQNFTTSFFPQFITPPGTTVDSIVWNFGDSAMFTGLTSPTHLYANPGTYLVTMTLYNSLLCTATFIDSITVYPLPVASFTSSLACTDLAVNFNSSASSVNNDTITSWLWNFNGLGTSNTANSNFAFSDSGTYDITLTVTTSHGCSNTIVNQVTVIQSPDFDFTYTEPCDGSPAQFTFVSNVNPPPPATPSWVFGDGNSSSVFNPLHLYGNAGSFTVSLNIFNAITGCSADKIKIITIHPNPVTGFTAAANCEELPLQLNDTSTVASGTITSWLWDFGTVGLSSAQNPVVTFNQAGTLPVNLTATSSFGCSTTYNGTVLIFPKPVAAFIPDPLFGSPPLTVNFINNSTGAQTYNWSFGDNTFGSGLSPFHVYTDTGSYQISMIAISDNGCLDTAYYNLSVLVPFMDIAVQKIYATVYGDQLKLSADISNEGNLMITSFVIKGTIEDGSIINENYKDTLIPGQTINYQFNSSYQINPYQLPGFYCVAALNPNESIDQKPENNSKCSVIDNSFEIFSAYPVPFENQLSLNFNLPFSGLYDIEIYDSAAKLVYRENAINGFKGFNLKTIFTTSFSKGIYACSIRYRDDIRIVKVIKL